MLKQVILLFMAVIFMGLSNSLSAYNEKQYARFFVTKKCHGCDLYKASFSGADLTNADFTGSNLILANFQNATLYGANLTDATISGANFNGALWIDGSICDVGSYGKCLKKDQK